MNLQSALSEQSLNLRAIHPSAGSKYSPNLYKWLTSRNRPFRRDLSGVFIHPHMKTMLIGRVAEIDFIGSRLISVLCQGGKAEEYAYGIVTGLTKITDFWPRYFLHGRCAIDPDHSMGFLNDKERWLVQGDFRTCQWCGNFQQRLRRWIEPIERQAWEKAA